MAKRKRILYVEDNPAVRTIRTLMMERDGYEVITAATVAEGLQALSNAHADLAVVDYGLPDGRGDHLCRELKQRSPGLPVVLVSGSVPEDLDASADAFLTKGEEPAELMRTIARLLGNRPQ